MSCSRMPIGKKDIGELTQKRSPMENKTPHSIAFIHSKCYFCCPKKRARWRVVESSGIKLVMSHSHHSATAAVKRCVRGSRWSPRSRCCGVNMLMSPEQGALWEVLGTPGSSLFLIEWNKLTINMQEVNSRKNVDRFCDGRCFVCLHAAVNTGSKIQHTVLYSLQIENVGIKNATILEWYNIVYQSFDYSV